MKNIIIILYKCLLGLLNIMRFFFTLLVLWSIINIVFSWFSFETMFTVSRYTNLLWVLVIAITSIIRVISNFVSTKINTALSDLSSPASPKTNNSNKNVKQNNKIKSSYSFFLPITFIILLIVKISGVAFVLIGVINLLNMFISENYFPDNYLFFNINPIISIIIGNVLLFLRKTLLEKLSGKSPKGSIIPNIVSGDDSNFQAHRRFMDDQQRLSDEHQETMNQDAHDTFVREQNQQMHDHNNHNNHNF